MHKPSRVVVPGPLAPHAAGFRRKLAGRQGYSRSRATGLLLMAHLSRWLASQGVDLRDLPDAHVERFISHRHVVSRDHRRLSARSVFPLLARTTPPGTAPGRYRPPDKLLAFL